jgi:cytidine deaminase
VTVGPEPGAPCGLCRQALSEFADDVPIALAVAGDETARTMTSLADLFPQPFRGDLLRH